MPTQSEILAEHRAVKTAPAFAPFRQALHKLSNDRDFVVVVSLSAIALVVTLWLALKFPLADATSVLIGPLG